MNKKLILHIVCGIVASIIYYMVFEGTTQLQAFFFFLIYIGLNLMFDFVLAKKRGSSIPQSSSAENVSAFIEAVGGRKNIVTTDFESSRVKVVLEDVDLVDQVKLEALSFDGAYLSGSQLQVTVGPNSSDFSRQINDAT